MKYVTRFGCKSTGFTLIEVLVVVVILSILAALIVPKIMDRPDEARVVAAKSDIRAITSALKLYRLDNGVYPSTEQGLQAMVKKPETGEVPRNWKSTGYLDRLPKDPWKNEYQYLNPGLQVKSIYSLWVPMDSREAKASMPISDPGISTTDIYP
jgi:general secretion pathway protein G